VPTHICIKGKTARLSKGTSAPSAAILANNCNKSLVTLGCANLTLAGLYDFMWFDPIVIIAMDC